MIHASGLRCANCGATLGGPYCHICGQPSDDKHRSILHLMWEGIEGLTHLDGRLGQTLPLLLFNPGKLARVHFEGRRQRHVPPFRLFFITLLIFMVSLESVFHGASENLAHINVLPSRHGARVLDIAGKPPAKTAAPGEMSLYVASIGDKPDASHVRVQSQLNKALANKDYYLTVLFTWAHRLTILLLPILAGLLALAYIRRRNFFIYDHLVVSMQFLSFVFIVSAPAALMPDPVRPWAIAVAATLIPINLYQTLRGAYGSSWSAAILKAAFLWVSTIALFGALMSGLMSLALMEVAG